MSNGKKYYFWMGHLDKHRVIEFKAKVINKEPLRIGAGRGEVLGSPIDLPVLRVSLNGREVPFIPGSSWKGLFRSYFDVFIRSNGGYTCGAIGKTSCMSTYIQCDYCGEEIIENSLEKIARDLSLRNNYRALKRLLWENLCLSCKVFGSQSYSSKIVFYDSYPLSDVRLGVKTGIAIDRRTGAAAKGALYQVEYVEPGATFSFNVVLHTVPNYVVGLLAQALNDINIGLVKVGGFKTRGFGKVELREPALTIIIYDEIGGRLEDNRTRLVLPRLDHVDEEVSVELKDTEFKVQEDKYSTRIELKGERVWGILSEFTKTWADEEKLNRIIEEHKPRWLQGVSQQ